MSNREWLRHRLLERMRGIDQAVVNDAALKDLADRAANRISQPGGGYGEIDVALSSVPKMIETLAAVDRGPPKKKPRPISAAELKRLRDTGKLPRMPPWF